MVYTFFIGLLILFIIAILITIIFEGINFFKTPKFINKDDSIAKDFPVAGNTNTGKTSLKAVVMCNPERDVKKCDFTYEGPKDCRLVKDQYSSINLCKTGCIGFGTCNSFCERDAIIIKNGVAVVSDSCDGCGKCIDICPNSLIKLVPKDAQFAVLCSAHDGENSQKICSTACNACGWCTGEFPYKGFIMKNNCAVVDYNHKEDRTAVAEHCPNNCIVKLKPYSKKSFVFWKSFFTMINGHQ